VRRILLACAPASALMAGCVIDVLREDEVGESPRCEAAHFWPREFAEREDTLLELLNDIRLEGGMCGATLQNPVDAVALSPELKCAARLHAVDIATTGTLGHRGSDGSDTQARVDAALYDNIPSAELLAADFTDPERVLEAWAESPEHCEEVFRARSDEVGIGYGENEDGDAAAWVVVFGELRHKE
jgi:uncharacterized protein YkwD